jgi:hypothetical protein
MGIGAALATLPYWWTGNSRWVADYDELAFYLPLGAISCRDHPWRLTDPVTGGPTYYQPLPTLPGVLIARLFGLDVWHLGLCWRVLGGLLVGGTWYLLLRTAFQPVAALAAACILLADPGVLHGQLGYGLAKACARPVVLQDSTATPTAASLPQWRILNPVLSWPWWLAFLALTARAVQRPNWGRIAAAGIACGLLFHIYFYLWTAAIAGLVLALAVDRARWKAYCGIGAIALLIGLPALFTSIQFRAEHGSDWLVRTDKFIPVGRFEEILIPRITVVFLVAAWVWVWRRGWQWVWLAAIATASLLLLNQTIVTGLQIENFHWLFALGPALSLLIVVLVADLFGQLPSGLARRATIVAAALAVAAVAAGGWLYARAAAGLPENQRIREATADFLSRYAGMSVPVGVVAGDPDFQYLAAVQYDLRPLAGYSAVLSPITDAELDERIALNAHLLGWTRDRFATEQEQELKRARWGPAMRSVESRSTRLAARLSAFDALAADVLGAAERFEVRTLALPAGGLDAAPSGWMLLQSGPRWDVWVRSR